MWPRRAAPRRPRTDMASQRLSPGSALTGPIVPIELPKAALCRPPRRPPTPASPSGGSGGPRWEPIGSAGVPFGPRFLPGKSPCRRSGLSLCAIFFFSSPRLAVAFSLLLLPELPASSLLRRRPAPFPGPQPLLQGGESKVFD